MLNKITETEFTYNDNTGTVSIKKIDIITEDDVELSRTKPWRVAIDKGNEKLLKEYLAEEDADYIINKWGAI